ncbi:hypothetical protein B0H14DRAFT_115971 [Mycena olivaceomarginata]|nr:hypothetical protein B0H14DRAFT_115971 [Mycena olivaceomarginata]
MWLISCFVCDLSIAATLVYIFSKSKNDLAETNTLLNRLIMRTIQSGVIPVAVAALHIIMFSKYPNTFLDLPPVYTGGKLYANIVFANLNGRKRQIQTLETSGINLEFYHRRNSAQISTTARDGSTVGVHSANVHITTEVETFGWLCQETHTTDVKLSNMVLPRFRLAAIISAHRLAFSDSKPCDIMS